METKVFTSLTITFCLCVGILISSTECTPFGDQKGHRDGAASSQVQVPAATSSSSSESTGTLDRSARQFIGGYPGYGFGGLGGFGVGGSAASAAAAATSSSTGGLGLGYPYGK